MEALKKFPSRNILETKRGTSDKYTDAQGGEISVWGKVRFSAQFIHNNQHRNVEVIAQVASNWKSSQIILGIDFLHYNNVEISPRQSTIKIGKDFVIKYSSTAFFNNQKQVTMESISSDSSSESKPHSRPKLLMQFGTQVYSVLLDTGATHSVISESVLSKLPKRNILKIDRKTKKQMVDFQSNKVNITGRVNLKTTIPALNNKKKTLECKLKIVDNPLKE